MTSYNPDIFTQFIFDALSADASITSLVTGIYSYALQETDPPYLLIEIDNARPLNAAEFAGLEIEFTIKCYSVEASYSESFAIMEKVFAALQDYTGSTEGSTEGSTGSTEGSTEGYQIINTRLVDSEYERFLDGNGIQASLEFRSIIQEN